MIRSLNLEWSLVLEAGRSCMRLSSLINKIPQSSLAPSTLWGCNEKFATEKGPSFNHPGTLILGFQPQELWAVNFCCLKAIHSWYFVRAVWKIQDTIIRKKKKTCDKVNEEFFGLLFSPLQFMVSMIHLLFLFKRKKKTTIKCNYVTFHSCGPKLIILHSQNHMLAFRREMKND